MKPTILWLCVFVVCASSSRSEADQNTLLDRQVRRAIQFAGIQPIATPSAHNPDQVYLGKMLFFDRILGGNRDTACATCHHDFFATGDALNLSIGTKGTGLGPTRVKGADRPFVPRNAPHLFNLGLPEIRRQFWDSRVEKLSDGTFRSPAGAALPSGFTNVLQIQAMFPVTGRDEMRGVAGDLDVENQPNELATIADTNLPGIWQGLMARLLGAEGGTNSNLPSYATLFATAYPDVPQNQLGFQHAAMAIAAFEADTYLAVDTPWDNYVAGQNGALTTSAKRGALIFFGRGRCASCHSGNLFTDQEHHNILVPQLGPGKAPFLPDDVGRQDFTKVKSDRYKFRTPSLRNVAVTGPYMHDGAFATLPAAVQHHLNPVVSFWKYDPKQLIEPALESTVQNSFFDLLAHWTTVDIKILLPTFLSKSDQQDLSNFLNSLTSPSLSKLPDNVPDEVPSGLPVDGVKVMP